MKEKSNIDTSSSLYSEELAPIPPKNRTWKTLDLAALWVGMAVCIPTYLLASYMIKSGVSWYMALIIIGVANLIITVPMTLNGHAGVKYGISFPVLGRVSFGIYGIHIASLVRAIVACGWFGIQTWIGGLAFYAIWNAITGTIPSKEIVPMQFVCFGLFWLLNMYFIWKGTDSIKWLEKTSAPILIIMGLYLIGWGAYSAGSFTTVLDYGRQLQNPTATLILNKDSASISVQLNPLKDKKGKYKAEAYQLIVPTAVGIDSLGWEPIDSQNLVITLEDHHNSMLRDSVVSGDLPVKVQFKGTLEEQTIKSSVINLHLPKAVTGQSFGNTMWGYILWLTAMVGFWATMSISISDITRFAPKQKHQIAGQFIGLPGTMILYSFVGIFVTFAAVVNFQDIMIAEDAPWDPVNFLAHFKEPWVVVVAQIFMIIATLSTNIAANVIAPATAFSNVFPKKIDFKKGGYITGLIGILICPWWLLDDISSLLILVSGLLGPVLGILLCDYFLVRKTNIDVSGLYQEKGPYFYKNGFNPMAVITLIVSIFISLLGKWIPEIEFLYNLSWFTGFFISFVLYYVLMKAYIQKSI